MTVNEIKAMQQRITAAGFPLGEIDGWWGEKSINASRKYLRSLGKGPNPWPTTDERSLQAFYGSPGVESKLVYITFPYPIRYEGKFVKKTRCHRKVADSLLRVLNDIGDRWSGRSDVMEEAQDYGGLFNNRPMRGGSRPSLHARGAAIDLDADDNGNMVKWPERADMPLEIMECFAREHWMSAGAFWLRDAMHFQATA